MVRWCRHCSVQSYCSTSTKMAATFTFLRAALQFATRSALIDCACRLRPSTAWLAFSRWNRYLLQQILLHVLVRHAEILHPASKSCSRIVWYAFYLSHKSLLKQANSFWMLTNYWHLIHLPGKMPTQYWAMTHREQRTVAWTANCAVKRNEQEPPKTVLCSWIKTRPSVD